MDIININDDVKTGASVLLYCKPGVGKTYLLGRLPGKTLVIDTDRGSKVLRKQKDVKDVDVVYSSGMDQLSSHLAELEGKCIYDTVCIDTLTEVREAFLTHLSMQNLTKDGKPMCAPQQGDYLRASYTLQNVLRSYKNLVEKGVNIIFTAWETPFTITTDSGVQIDQLIPMVGSKNGADAQKICGMVDTVGYLMKDPNSEARSIMFESKDGKFYAKDRAGRKGCKPEELLNDNNTSEKVVEVPNTGTDAKAKTASPVTGQDKNNNKIEGEK